MSSRIEELIERDGPECVWCSRQPWREDLTVEHVLPRSRGGNGERVNLLLACKSCNHARRSQAVVSYLRKLIEQGKQPRLSLLTQSLERMAGSTRRVHREYALAQLRQIRRL